MQLDRIYWNNFYRRKSAVNFPSSFAEFFVSKVVSKTDMVLELGCGNGRDAHYIAKHCRSVIGVDQSVESGQELDFSLTDDKRQKMENLTLIRDNFVKMDYVAFNSANVIYARFVMHAITDIEEDVVLSKINSHFSNGVKVAVEARTTNDPLYGVGTKIDKNTFHTDHSRRFIEVDSFKKKVETLGFKVTHLTESAGLSVFKGEDPVLMRIIFEKIDGRAHER